MEIILAFIAGNLTTLSPCVLPVLPFVTASSLKSSKFGPILLAAGLLVSFVGVTLLVSLSGQVLGIDPAILRKTAGVLLTVSGIFLMSQRLSDFLAMKISVLTGNLNRSHGSESLIGEFLSGVLLGVVWTPCSGPSLGAALGLATQGGTAARIAIILLAFGVGAVLPLLLVAYGARSILQKMRTQAGTVYFLKKTFGLLIILFGVSIVNGWDRAMESALTDLLPDAWLNFVTRF